MKKSIKNTIMIGMAAVLIGTSAITVSYAQINKGANQFAPPSFSQQADGEQNGNPFENFDRDADGKNSNGFNQSHMPNQQGDSSQQPQAPNQQNGDSSQQPQAPNQQNGDSSQQPQAPPSNSENSDSKTESDSSSSTNTSLSVEALAAEDGNTTQSTQQKMPTNGFRGKNGGVISALCYMFAALQIAIILAILAYLIISKFNDISFNEVLANMRKSNKEA